MLFESGGMARMRREEMYVSIAIEWPPPCCFQGKRSIWKRKVYRQMEIRRKREMESESSEDIEWCLWMVKDLYSPKLIYPLSFTHTHIVSNLYSLPWTTKGDFQGTVLVYIFQCSYTEWWHELYYWLKIPSSTKAVLGTLMRVNDRSSDVSLIYELFIFILSDLLNIS